MKRRWKWAFFVMTLSTVSLIAWQTKRASEEQALVNSQLAEIKRNTQQPPQVNVSAVPPSHTHLAFLPPIKLPIRTDRPIPFYGGEVVRFNLGLSNPGDFPAVDSTIAGLLVVTPDPTATNGDFERLLGSVQPMGCGSIGPHSPELGCFRTYQTAPITNPDSIKLNAGTLSVCLLGRSTWKDDTGNYRADFFECLSAESPTVFQWHVSSQDHNKEFRQVTWGVLRLKALLLPSGVLVGCAKWTTDVHVTRCYGWAASRRQRHR